MSSNDRRELIYASLLNSQRPLKGTDLARDHGVTRQIIVKDIAILRAEGKDIIATPEGYIVNKGLDNYIKKIIAVSHTREKMYDELKTIIKYGGRVQDVIVEHPLYGEIRCNLMLKTMADLEEFMLSFERYNAEPLSALTGGMHLHTIAAETNESLENIERELINKGYILED